MDYELYHDESQIDGYWHGILLVPVNKKSILFGLLETARHNTRFRSPIGIKNIHERNRVYDCADAWIQIAIAAFLSKNKPEKYPIFMGKKETGRRSYSFINQLIGTKFILFCERDRLRNMEYSPDYGSKVEITFRMGLKGGLHYLGTSEEPINIIKMHFDNHEHLQRHIDRRRIIERIGALREYCSITNGQDVIDDRSGNHEKQNCQDYMDCQFIQLTDLLVGGFRSSLGYFTNPLHIELSKPIKSLIKRYSCGYARMRNSRWFKSFSMSQCFIENGSWHFQELDCIYKGEPEQLQLL